MKKKKQGTPKRALKGEKNFGVEDVNSEMLAALTQRIRRCADVVGSGDALALAAGIPRRTLETYLSGEAEPKTLRLVSIARAANVNLEWLATGEGPMKKGEGVAVAPLDRGVLLDVIAVVEEFLEERGLRLEPEKKAELLVLLYEDVREHEGKVDRARIIKMVNLAA